MYGHLFECDQPFEVLNGQGPLGKKQIHKISNFGEVSLGVALGEGVAGGGCVEPVLEAHLFKDARMGSAEVGGCGLR